MLVHAIPTYLFKRCVRRYVNPRCLPRAESSVLRVRIAKPGNAPRTLCASYTRTHLARVCGKSEASLSSSSFAGVRSPCLCIRVPLGHESGHFCRHFADCWHARLPALQVQSVPVRGFLVIAPLQWILIFALASCQVSPMLNNQHAH